MHKNFTRASLCLPQQAHACPASIEPCNSFSRVNVMLRHLPCCTIIHQPNCPLHTDVHTAAEVHAYRPLSAQAARAAVWLAKRIRKRSTTINVQIVDGQAVFARGTDGRASPSVPWLISCHMVVRKKPPRTDDPPHHVMRMYTRTKTLCIPSWCKGTSTIVPSRTRGGIRTWTVCSVSTIPWP